jgi:hypothetical protein
MAAELPESTARPPAARENVGASATTHQVSFATRTGVTVKHREPLNGLFGLALTTVIAATALVAGHAEAKDLFVATNGNDSVSYAANDQSNPWRTLEFAVPQVRAGDTLFVRGGTYQATASIDVDSRTGVGYSGTAQSWVRIQNFPGENAIIDLSTVPEWLFIVGLHYWEISGLEFRNALIVVYVGGTALNTTNVTVRNLKVTMNRGGDNRAAIAFGPTAGYGIADGNEVVGPGSDGGVTIHNNTGCIHIDKVETVKVLNNRLSNCPNGIHFKHANNNVPTSEIEIAYNLFENCGRSGLHYNGNFGFIHDNIFGPGAFFTMPLPNGGPGGHNNRIEHNTFVGSGISLTDASGDLQNVVIRNNIFTSAVDISKYRPMVHNTALDYNLHPTGTAVNEFGVTYTLPQWRSYYGGSSSSIAASPTFVGGAQPSTVDGYRLSTGSAGVGQASDGTDLGARLDLFGTSGLPLLRPNAPMALTVN